MKWITLIPTTIATLVAVVGWIVAYRFSSARDIKNKQREIRVKYLAEIYDVLLELGRNVDILGNYREVERAVSYIHLYGNAKQVSLCEAFVRDLTQTGGANQTELVVEIRNSIREELGLEILSTKLNLLKVTPKKPGKDQRTTQQ
jgi:heme/copper-type cytochrome/quinol oxidase subunit 2